jgi:tryptophan 2,3-dioxygenase
MVADINLQPQAQQSEQLPKSIRSLLDTPYAIYLNLEEVFDIQVVATENAVLHHPEEVLFRSVHLSSELWLRLAGYEIERARDALNADLIIHATRLVNRARMSVERVMEGTRMLETMPAAEYHQFRIHLGGASGLQSPGYAYLRRECRSLSTVLDDKIGDDDALFALYSTGRMQPEYDLCEALLDLDATLDRFRALHLQIAERFLGETTQGTGGQGVGYLRQNVGHRLFPRLWALRERLANDAGAVGYGYGTASS